MTEEEMINEALTPKHVALFEENALKLARKVFLTQDWSNEEWTGDLKQMAKDLIPKKWFKNEF